MKVDTSGWKEFRVGELFRVVPAKGKNSTLLNDGDDVAYIAASKENNGFNRMVSIVGFEDWVSEGNCLQLVHIGDAAAGWCNYVHDDFIAMSGKSSCAYNDHMNEYSGLFIAAVIQQVNRGKYSFKESWTGQRVYDTVIKLPTTSVGEPDWDYMEQYMRQVMDACERKYQILTQIAKERHPVDVSGWGEFRVGELFDVCLSSDDLQLKDLDEGSIPLVSSGMNNNGVCGMVDSNIQAELFPAGTLTVDMFGKAFYQSENYFAVSHGRINILKPKAVVSEAVGLFLQSVLDAALSGKYSYGLLCTSKKIAAEVIRLPVTTSGELDWDYMEQYMWRVMNRPAHVVECLRKMQAN